MPVSGSSCAMILSRSAALAAAEVLHIGFPWVNFAAGSDDCRRGTNTRAAQILRSCGEMLRICTEVGMQNPVCRAASESDCPVGNDMVDPIRLGCPGILDLSDHRRQSRKSDSCGHAAWVHQPVAVCLHVKTARGPAFVSSLACGKAGRAPGRVAVGSGV